MIPGNSIPGNLTPASMMIIDLSFSMQYMLNFSVCESNLSGRIFQLFDCNDHLIFLMNSGVEVKAGEPLKVKPDTECLIHVSQVRIAFIV